MKVPLLNPQRIWRILLVLVVLLGSDFMAMGQKTPQFIFQNGSATGNNAIPLYGGTYATYRNQWFYAPGDFGTNVPAGKAITKIYVRAAFADPATVWGNLNISMGQPNITGLSTAWVTGLKSVYFATAHAQSAVAVDEWIEFVLTTPFPYNPKLPLVIETVTATTTGGIRVRAGGTPIDPAYTGNTQTYGPSSNATGTTRRYSYSMGIDLKSLGPNDAGISSLIKPKNFCPGTQDVEVQVENFGTNQVKGVTINWSLNGVLQTPLTYSSTLDTANGTGSTKAAIKLTSLTFTSSSVYNLKAWTTNPNSVKDTVGDNDTLSVVLKPSLSGTFTIGGTSPNFKTFTEAVKDISSFGICGPVTFNVRAGTYKERIVIPQINGASANNTITFAGASNTTTILDYTGTSTADMQTVLLDGADYITFKDMTISNNGATYGVGVHFMSSADYNSILNCNIITSTTSTSAYTIGILGSATAISYTAYGNTGNYNTIKGNNITGGYYGIRWNGTSTAVIQYGNTVQENTIANYYYYGIYSYYSGVTDILYNNINTTRQTSAYGILNYYGVDFTIEGNNINVPYYGMYIYYCNNYIAAKKRGKVVNNMVRTGTYYPINLYYSYNTDVYHNTFLTDNSTYAGYFYYATDADIRNNIFVNNGTGTTNRTMYVNYSSFGSSPDYNIYYQPNNTAELVFFDATYYKDLAAWKAVAPQYNKNSLQVDPNLISSTDLHLKTSGTATLPVGAQLNVDQDVDGDYRCQLTPTIGADESLIGKSVKSSTAFNVPDSVFVGSLTTIFSALSPGAAQRNTWYIDGKMVKDSLHLDYIFPNSGNIQVKMVGRTCTDRDSLTKTVKVIAPTTAPAVAFLASNNIIRESDIIRLTDMSKGGPSSWTWDISPLYGYDAGVQYDAFSYLFGTNKNSPKPIIRFNYSGKYTVKLTVSNLRGTATLTKVDYIEVLPLVKMVKNGETNSPSGILTDDGGIAGNYSNNAYQTMLIDPCASDVYLTFSVFDMECGLDYLRIYDGVDNTGIPLHFCTNNKGSSSPFNGPGFTGGPTIGNCTDACAPKDTDTLIAKSGKMFIEFVSSSATNTAGFEAFWWSTPSGEKPPVAEFSIPDTICANSIPAVVNTTKGNNVKFFWDVDGDFTSFEGSSRDIFYPFFAEGISSMTLIVYNCAGSDTLTKSFYVKNPPVPKPDFTSDAVKPSMLDMVTFTPEIKACVDEYRWTFTHSLTNNTKVTYMNGSNFRSQMPQVIFSDTGCWNVKLWVKNFSGQDSITKNCFIKVKEAYCTPTVGTIIPDIGISRVKFGDIDNSSAQGKKAYTSFQNTHSTVIERDAKYDLTIARTSAFNAIDRTAWIDWDGDGKFDASEIVAEEVNSTSLSFTKKIVVPSNAYLGVVTLRVAVNGAGYGNKACGTNNYGEYEDYRIIIRRDQTPPVITLMGADTMLLEQGRTYTEPGWTAIDYIKGDLTGSVIVTNPLKNRIIGTYVLRYDVTDGVNNAITKLRIIKVIADTTAPELRLSLPDTITIPVFTSLKLPNPDVILAEDILSGDLKSQVVKSGSVDTAKVGTYILSYTVVDGFGNTATKNRVIHVVDKIAPVLTLMGTDTMYHEVKTPFTDPGYSTTDNYYMGNDIEVSVSGNVNVDKPGTYVLVYTATEPSGNSTSMQRIVIVRDTKAPMVSAKGQKSIILDVHSSYADFGATAEDEFEGKKNTTTTGTYYSKFPDGEADSLGNYTVVYMATDASGNVGTDTVFISVLDRKAPVASLIGSQFATACRWQPYIDAGVTVTDNYQYAVITQTTQGTFVDTDLPGVFTIQYKVVDQSGNVAYSLERRIEVQECLTGIGQTAGKKEISIYPNPSKGLFTISLGSNMQNERSRISVLDMQGREVAVISEGTLGTDKVAADLSYLSGGLYFVVVTQPSGRVQQRISIVK